MTEEPARGVEELTVDRRARPRSRGVDSLRARDLPAREVEGSRRVDSWQLTFDSWQLTVDS
ncbi:hypothetical protein [Microcoleus sp. bin38.metabat.b11b12b14.051]|uniref:hypothetical protein n=1 Tax=Microcoleus sp. bin38.metabat.b11b12b14.051 TaxID=2742709 RepID=UPI0025E56F6E|nr:hypothetical protein [Microcoleus sp. bin38.metabat.b11b12b14.051]